MFHARLKRKKEQKKTHTHKSWPAWDVHLYGVVNDEVGGTDGVNLHWVSAKSLDCFTHGSKVHNHRHATGDTNNRFAQPQHWWYKQQISTTTGTRQKQQISTTTETPLVTQTDFHNHRDKLQTTDFHNHRHSTGDTNNRFPQPQAHHWRYKQHIFTTRGTSLAVQNKQQISTTTGTPPAARNKQQVSTTKHRHTTGIVAIQTTYIHIHSSLAMQTRTPPVKQNRQQICTTTAAKNVFPPQNTGTALVTQTTDFHNSRQMTGNAINRFYTQTIHFYNRHITDNTNRFPQPQAHYWQQEQ